MKNLLTLLLLIFTFQISFGQEVPEAEIYDKIGYGGCHDIKMRAVDFVVELSKDPNSIGYAVIHERIDGKKRTELIERIVAHSAYLLNLEYMGLVNRPILRVVYGEPRENFEIEFWKVPKGAKEPNYTSEFFPEKLPVPLKPFIFGSEYEGGSCPTFSIERYVSILKANPSFNAHIVVNTDYSFQDFVKETLKDLTNEHKISRSRIKFFYIKKRNDIFLAEYWIVPNKKRK